MTDTETDAKMSTTNSATEPTIAAKKSKSNDGEGSSQMMVPADGPNQQLTTHIHQLGFDCFEQMFKWLSLKNLLKLRLTCKPFKEHADKYIRSNYPKFKFGYGKVEIDNYNIQEIQRLDPEVTKLIKKIKFTEIGLDDEDINSLKGILAQIEELEMENGMIEGDFYKSMFQFCPMVKHLSIKGIGGDTIIGPDNEWLNRSYPNLESVYFDDTDECYETYRGSGDNNPALLQFFQMNPNLRTFATTYAYFVENWQWLMDGDVEIDQLKIQLPLSTGVLNDRICTAFQQLYAKGAYKRLRLSNVEIENGKHLDLIGSIPALEILYMETVKCAIVLPTTLTSLKEIGIIYGPDIKRPDRLARNLINVERIYIQSAKPIDILPFVRYSANVNTLYVDNLLNGPHFENDIFDVVALNKEREKFNGACKQTIYVKEKIYLATKSASLPTECSLVELGRAEACKFDCQKFGD